MSVLTAWPRTGYALPEPPPEPLPPDPTPGPEPAWVTHPAIPASEGITGLLAVADRLVIPYGRTWTGGAYPIATVDLTTGTPLTGPTVPTEGFARVRLIDGTIYLVWVDPTGPWHVPQGYSYSTDDGASWQTQVVAPAYHWFDLKQHDGALFMCGSGPGVNGAQSAIVYRSDDDGTTWQESLRVYGGVVPRFRFLAERDGALWVRTLHGPLPDAAYRLAEDGTWAIAPEPSDLAGDGTLAFEDDTHTYRASQTTGWIQRAPLTDPGNWADWLHMGEGMGGYIISAATLHDGYVYVGGTQGRIWRFDAPA